MGCCLGDNTGKCACLDTRGIHQVGDDERGYLLELLLTKLRYINDKQAGRVGQAVDAPAEQGQEMEEDIEGLQSSTEMLSCWVEDAYP